MSGEILLLMLVFIVLPLIEQAIKNARRKREGGAAGRQEPPPRRAPRPARTPPPRAPEPFHEEEDEEDDEQPWVARPPLPPPLPPAPRQAPHRTPRPAPTGRRAAPPAGAPPVPAEVLMAQRARLKRLAVSASPELAAGAARRQRRVRLPELRRPESLKRAIVLQAVLGPCRANDPHA